MHVLGVSLSLDVEKIDLQLFGAGARLIHHDKLKLTPISPIQLVCEFAAVGFKALSL